MVSRAIVCINGLTPPGCVPNTSYPVVRILDITSTGVTGRNVRADRNSPSNRAYSSNWFYLCVFCKRPACTSKTLNFNGNYQANSDVGTGLGF